MADIYRESESGIGIKMKKQRFICKKCRCEFEKNVFEPGEAKEKHLPSYPVVCPRCGSGDIQEAT